MDDIQIIEEFKKQLQDVFPDVEVYFYGSRANGTYRLDSDYDVLVILNDVNRANRDTVYEIAWNTGFKYDAFISPVLTEKDEFTKMSDSPFFINVKNTGIVIC